MGRRKEQKPFIHIRKVCETKNPAPADLDLSLAWYLVYTAPRMEAKAAKGLADAGCAVFLPSVHKVVRFQRREMDFTLATFPRYFFAAGVPTLRRDRFLVADDGVTVITLNGRPLSDIREIEGVQDIVRTRDQWARVPAPFIKAVADYQNDPRAVRCSDPRKPALSLQPGQTVRIIDGPFMRFLAVVVEQVGLREADVMINLLGPASRMRVSTSSLDAA